MLGDALKKPHTLETKKSDSKRRKKQDRETSGLYTPQYLLAAAGQRPRTAATAARRASSTCASAAAAVAVVATWIYDAPFLLPAAAGLGPQGPPFSRGGRVVVWGCMQVDSLPFRRTVQNTTTERQKTPVSHAAVQSNLMVLALDVRTPQR